MKIERWFRRFALCMFFFICVCFSCFTSGCATEAPVKRFPALITHFSKNGIVINGVGQLAYQLAQAEAGYCFRIGKREIGVYQYNLERKKQRHRYQLVVDSGVLYINGKKFKALINGPFVMIDFDTHPDQTKIVKAFESF